MKLDGYDAYRYYMAVKMHFESESYDILKYNYKTSVNERAFWKRRDKYHFSKVANKFNDVSELISFFVANFVNGKKWVGDMLTDETPWTEFQKRHQSLSYTFEQDLNTLSEQVDESFDDLFKVTNDSPYPMVVDRYLAGDVCIETLVILYQLTKFLDHVKVADTIVYPDVSKKVRKYATFVSPDPTKMREIVMKLFTK